MRTILTMAMFALLLVGCGPSEWNHPVQFGMTEDELRSVVGPCHSIRREPTLSNCDSKVPAVTMHLSYKESDTDWAVGDSLSDQAKVDRIGFYVEIMRGFGEGEFYRAATPVTLGITPTKITAVTDLVEILGSPGEDKFWEWRKGGYIIEADTGDRDLNSPVQTIWFSLDQD